MTALSEDLQRLIVGSFVTAVMITLFIFTSHPEAALTLNLIASLLAVGALYETYSFTEATGAKPMKQIGALFSFLFFLSLFLTDRVALSLFLLFLFFFCCFVYQLIKGTKPIQDLSTTFFGFCYIVLPASAFFFLENEESGWAWVAFTLTVTKLSDVFAYYGGRLFGKHPLAPEVSPRKTIEGALSGLLFALIGALFIPHLINSWMAPFAPSLGMRIFLGLSIGVLAPIGDLSESLLKRDASLKDSNSLPGLGGLMDLIDSLVFTLPLVYFTVKGASL